METSSAAKPAAMAALELAKNREVQYGAALALAIAGDSSQAQTLTNDLESSFPEDTSVKFNYLPVRTCVSCAEPWRSRKGDRTSPSFRSL